MTRIPTAPVATSLDSDGRPGRARLTDMVRENLVARIMGGELTAGDALPSEAELAQELKVSKTVIREGLRELAGLGLVAIRQGRATEVRAFDSQPFDVLLAAAARSHELGFRDLIEFRRALECEAAALAAERRTEAQLARLHELLEELGRNRGPTPHGTEVDWQFHAQIVEAADNQLLVHLFTALKPQVTRMQQLLRIHRQRSGLKQAYLRHCELFEAIRDGDPARARRVMEKHFTARAADLIAVAERLAGQARGDRTTTDTG